MYNEFFTNHIGMICSNRIKPVEISALINNIQTIYNNIFAPEIPHFSNAKIFPLVTIPSKFPARK